MKICTKCKKEAASWTRKKGKKYEHLEQYLCDKCLMDTPKPSEAIDDYNYLGKKK